MIFSVCPHWGCSWGGGGRGRQILLGLAQEIGNTQPELLDRILIFLILCDVQPTTYNTRGTRHSSLLMEMEAKTTHQPPLDENKGLTWCITLHCYALCCGATMNTLDTILTLPTSLVKYPQLSSQYNLPSMWREGPEVMLPPLIACSVI